MYGVVPLPLIVGERVLDRDGTLRVEWHYLVAQDRRFEIIFANLSLASPHQDHQDPRRHVAAWHVVATLPLMYNARGTLLTRADGVVCPYVQ